MALHMREQLIRAVLAHAQGEIAKHRANVEVYLEHPAGIGEHSRYDDQVEVINKYFRSSSTMSDIDRRSHE